MGNDKPSNQKRKGPQTVRERSRNNAQANNKPRRLKKTAGSIGKPVSSLRSKGKREFYLPLPENKFGEFLNKRRSFIPRYFKNSWEQLRQVTWPNRKETAKLTMAVLVFAIILGIIITVADYGLDKIFRRILLDL